MYPADGRVCFALAFLFALREPGDIWVAGKHALGERLRFVAAHHLIRRNFCRLANARGRFDVVVQ
jgi:hypothetical protein